MSIVYDNALARERAIGRVRSIERFLDSAFVLPVLRLRAGFDGVLGLVPVLGNLITTSIALVLVYEAVRLGCRPWTIAKMLGNVGLDFVLGEIPVAGDIADFLFKANKRNLALLNAELGFASAAETTTTWSGGNAPARRFVANTAG